jgi:glycosyltransferase involved in cell wall biosynthesis
MRIAEKTNPALRLLVAIPCLNEASTIRAVIQQIPRTIDFIGSVDVVVIDDGSSDDTAVEARSAGADVIHFPVNRGVGVAFQAAVEYAIKNGFDLMVNIDGDGQFNPADIPLLVAPVVSHEVEMVTASRFVDKDFMPHMPKVKRYGNHAIAALISHFVNKKFADVSCGFRCYSREALLRMNLQGKFTYTQETFLDFAVKNIGIKEVPVRVQYFPGRVSRVANSIVKYGYNAGKIILRGYRDYFPLRFFWSISLAFGVPAVLMSAFFMGHYLSTGAFAPYIFVGFIAAALFALSALFFVLGIVADMLDRIRSNQERILYILKKSGMTR